MSGIFIHVAEDDPDDREMFQEAVLDQWPAARLRFSEDGEQFLDQFDLLEQPSNDSLELPDVIVLDLNLPKISGKECLTHLKSNDRLRHIPIIVMTSSQDEEEVLECYRLGVSSYLTKPNSSQDMKSMVAAMRVFWTSTARLHGLPRKAH